ncbi:MAG: tripartite tricarboxylate transporter TctB family protein [Acetivibrionales bacterium]|jgi:putative tricarboxylic transport membrane protein
MSQQNKEQKKTVGDFIIGLLLVIGGIFVMIVSLNMKIFRNFNDAPGFFPLFLGGILALLGAVLALQSIKKGALPTTKVVFSKENLKSFVKDDKTLRTVILIAILIVYIYILIGRMHFAIATMLYLTSTMLYLKSAKWWKTLIISAISTLFICIAFQYGFRIPLP